uniref:hypothetical protein n=1 Tax=Sphaerisporangium sp. CA-236357 TaxID=3240030 RepID=UPI003F497D14
MIEIPRWALNAAEPFLEAGWTHGDVLYALDHRPDGSVWVTSLHAHGTHKWAEYRLKSWLDGFGRPMTAHSQVLATEAAKRRAEMRALREGLFEQWARRSPDQVRPVQWARAMLAAASPSAARVMAEGIGRAPQRRRTGASRWDQIDQAARTVIASAPQAVEKDWVPPLDDELPVDEETMRRQQVLAMARTRARFERRQKAAG